MGTVDGCSCSVSGPLGDTYLGVQRFCRRTWQRSWDCEGIYVMKKKLLKQLVVAVSALALSACASSEILKVNGNYIIFQEGGSLL